MRIERVLDALDELVEQTNPQPQEGEDQSETPQTPADRKAYEAGFANATAKFHRELAKHWAHDPMRAKVHMHLAHAALGVHDEALEEYKGLVGNSTGTWIGHNTFYHQGQNEGMEHHANPTGAEPEPAPKARKPRATASKTEPSNLK